MAAIDIRIQRIEQLFDSLEPSPFHENEKALRRDAENYIVDFAGEHGRAEPLLAGDEQRDKAAPDKS